MLGAQESRQREKGSIVAAPQNKKSARKEVGRAFQMEKRYHMEARPKR